MHQNIVIGIGSAVLGFVAGSVTGWVLCEKKRRKTFEEEEEELKRYYANVSTYYRGCNPDLIREESGTELKDGEEAVSIQRENGPLSEEERKEIKEKLTRNHEQTTYYAGMYDAASYEHPREEDIVEQSEENRKAINRPPRIISREDYGDLPATVESQQLLFYRQNGVLVTEDGEVLDDPGLFVGNCLSKYGFDEEDNDEVEIFVQNFAQNTVYEITKVEDWYEEE